MILFRILRKQDFPSSLEVKVLTGNIGIRNLMAPSFRVAAITMMRELIKKSRFATP